MRWRMDVIHHSQCKVNTARFEIMSDHNGPVYCPYCGINFIHEYNGGD